MIRRLFMSEGEVNLAKLYPSDAAWLETWVNDPATTRHMATGRTPATVEMLTDQITAWKEPLDWPFAITTDDRVAQRFDPIGTVGLYGVDWITRKAELRILIGEPYCGHGVGTIATGLMVRFGFERLGLHRIWLGVTEENLRARRAYEKAGFFFEGTLIDDLYRDGRYYNSTRMAILRDTQGGLTWDTEKGKPATTSEPGPATAVRAVEQWTGYLRPGAA